MTTRITLSLPETTLERAEHWARRMGRSVDEVLVQAIESSLSPLGPEPAPAPPVTEWSDAEVLSAADLNMNEDDDRRLSELLHRQQANLLTTSERVELSARMLSYQEALLRKARGLSEAVRRGLRPAIAS